MSAVSQSKGQVVLPLEPRPRPSRRGRMFGGALVSAAAHLGVVAAIVLSATEARQMLPVDAIQVRLVTWQRPKPPPPLPAPDPSPNVPKHMAHETPPPEKSIARKTPAPPQADFLPVKASEKTSDTQSDGLTDADIAGASTAGTGEGGGGECNMARRIQNALRKDGLVQTAVASASGSSKAIMIWNGDWVQSHSEDGKGLAAVREAIVWEIAFAPQACKAQAMHGLMLISLHDGDGTARLAMGHGEWRWSDLLALRHSG